MVKLLQKTVFILALIVTVLYFVYTLCFSTPWAMGTRYGDFYTQAQEVNHTLFGWGLWTLVFTALALVFKSHSNRSFYLMNYLFIGLSARWMILTAQITLEIVPPLEPLYLALPTSAHRIVTIGNGTWDGVGTFEPITLMFDLAPWMAYALYVTAGLILAMGFYKLVKTVVRVLRAIARKTAAKKLAKTSFSSEVRP